MGDTITCPSGFARVLREIAMGLYNAGHEIKIVSWCYKGEKHDFPFELIPTINIERDYYGVQVTQMLINAWEPDCLFSIGDLHMIDWIPTIPERKKVKWIAYFPIDGTPLPKSWVPVINDMDVPVVYSKFAYDLVKAELPEKELTFIPHGVDTDVFYPLPQEEIDEFKESLGLKDKFVVTCFLPGTQVLMGDMKFKNIEDIILEEKVITHNQNIESVSHLFTKNYSGDIYNLKVAGLNDYIIATEEHPILSIKRDEIKCRFPSKQDKLVCRPSLKSTPCSNCASKEKPINKVIPKFNNISNLKVDDYVAIPLLNKVKNNISEINIFDYLGDLDGKIIDDYFYEKWSNSGIPINIPITKELMKLFGYFLAEGCYIYGSKNLNGLAWTFNINEIDYISEVKKLVHDIFNLEVNIHERPEGNSTLINVYNKTMAKLFKVFCGEYSKQKTIHSDLMMLEPELQFELLQGFINGDGCLVNNKHSNTSKIVFVTSSPILARQLWMIALRNRKVVSISKRKTGAYNISLTEENRYGCNFFFDDYFMCKITEATKENYNGLVYNLEVENDNTYIVNNIAVHNCVARNQWRKNLPALFKAYAEFAKDKDDVFLYYHGAAIDVGWDIPELMRRFDLKDKAGFPHEVTPMKGVPNELLNKIYNMGNLFALSTMGEGFGIPTLEAQSCGCPVLVTDYSACTELVQGEEELIKVKCLYAPAAMEKSGVTIDYALVDHDDFVEKLNNFYYDRELGKELGKKGRIFAENNTWNKFIGQFINLFETSKL